MYALDTNVVSELRLIREGRADPAVARWASSLTSDDLYLPAITLYESAYGVAIAQKTGHPESEALRAWIEKLRELYGPHILIADEEVAMLAAKYRVQAPHAVLDALIAATAKVNNLTVATRNVKDFKRFPVPVFNPWEYSDELGDNGE